MYAKISIALPKQSLFGGESIAADPSIKGPSSIPIFFLLIRSFREISNLSSINYNMVACLNTFVINFGKSSDVVQIAIFYNIKLFILSRVTRSNDHSKFFR